LISDRWFPIIPCSTGTDYIAGATRQADRHEKAFPNPCCCSKIDPLARMISYKASLSVRCNHAIKALVRAQSSQNI
jgi:hypothetical protein